MTLFRMLGTVDIGKVDALPGSTPSGMPKGLLLTLLLTPDSWVTRSAVIDLLWESPPKSAEANLRTYVCVVRRWLSAHSLERRLTTVRSGAHQCAAYRVSASGEDVDAFVFTELLEKGRRLLRTGHRKAAADTLNRAESLWRGTAGADAQGSQRLQAKLGLLNELRLEASSLLNEAMILLGDLRPLSHRIENLLTEHPLHERLWAQLLRVRYLMGEPTRALDTYRRASATLREELDVTPGPLLQRLHQAALSRDDEMMRFPRRLPIIGAEQN
ncbi:AfsR/SARP family transcriptional regulator [Streptosporangium jomthongense]|uniref:BTAD domain-containing putative transcriptional regulator n=1 Tax=Streptosporangium jomthongense TaxID=1193683 RepID=A0ABV8ETM5_9ACTN